MSNLLLEKFVENRTALTVSLWPTVMLLASDAREMKSPFLPVGCVCEILSRQIFLNPFLFRKSFLSVTHLPGPVLLRPAGVVSSPEQLFDHVTLLLPWLGL